MSVYSATTRLSSILKSYTTEERDKAKNAFVNKVRFKMPKEKGIASAINAVLDRNDFQQLDEFVTFLKESTLSDQELIVIINESRKIVHILSPKFTYLVESILTIHWTNRDPAIAKLYTDFCIDLLVAQNNYINFAISRLIAMWIPKDTDILSWENGSPNQIIKQELKAVHKLLDLLLTIIPMTFDVVLDTIENMFPYFKKPAHIVSGFVYNVLWLLDYRPIFMQYLMQLLFQKLVILDVNAPRNEIEESDELDVADTIMDDDQHIFKMEDCDDKDGDKKIFPLKHPIANTLDICMELLYEFLDKKIAIPYQIEHKNLVKTDEEAKKNFKYLITVFYNVLLPTHNTHHVQFLIFYVCSSKKVLAESFVASLWEKINNPNNSAVIRQAAVAYLGSFLSRSKSLPLKIIQNYLKELSSWARQYIFRGDECRREGSLKANLVFYSVCQSIFYIIAFRSRYLTAGKKELQFLESLHLSALVSCNLNPLRVCLPAVATAFAGVTRTYQLAYCHAILERNARRRLATVYMNDTSKPDEVLETFFPFDPYLLKLSEKRISQFYLQYQASEFEEVTTLQMNNLDKNDSSETMEDVDDFIIADKRQKISKSHERDFEFTYGLSPSFHM